jgi:hypothetical protein
MKCPKCQEEVAAGSLFCTACGARMPESNPPPSLGSQLTLGREVDAVSVGDMPTMKAARSRRFKTGEIILNRYRVLGELGQGGMGVVYRCLDQVGGIEVALKALPPELSHNSVEMEEVRENFQLVSRLVHQHIAAVKTLEHDPDTGDYYLILELVEGMDLRRWRRQQEGKATPEKVLPILRQVADALDFAHSRKIIHRDIKPSNVMVSADGAVKILDFGLAAQIRSSMSRVSRVQYETSGTGPYMAPEQWRGQYQDAATDQYALAVMAYELLSGRLPFETPDQMALRESVIREAPEKPDGVADNTWAALSRGLSKNREDRCASCAELVAALEGKKIPPPRASGKTPQPVPGRRKSRRGLMLTIAAGVVLVALGGWYWGIARPRQRAAAEVQRVTAEAARAAEQKARLAEQEQQAKIKAEADAYAALANSTTEDSLKAFLSNYPDGAHAATVKAGLDKLIAERKNKEDEAKKLEAGNAAREAARQAGIKDEFDAYVLLQANKTEAGLQAFLDRFPDGAHATEIKDALAKLKLEQASRKEEFDAFVLLQANKTEAGLQAFLDRFPNGAHATEIKDDLLKLRKEQEARDAEAAKRKALLGSVGGSWDLKFDSAPQATVTAVQIAQDGQDVRLTSGSIGQDLSAWNLEGTFKKNSDTSTLDQKSPANLMGELMVKRPASRKSSGTAPPWNLAGTFKDGTFAVAETRNYKMSGMNVNETLRIDGTISSDGLAIKGSFRTTGSAASLFSSGPWDQTGEITMTRKAGESSAAQGTNPQLKPAVQETKPQLK